MCFQLDYTMYRKWYKLTLACVWYFIVPFPIGPPPDPVWTRSLPCGDNRVALWHVTVANRAGASVAPNPIGIVIWVPAEVVLPLRNTLRPLQTGNPVHRFSRPPPVVDAICWFFLATNNIVSLPFLPGRQASAAVDNIFWWSWNEFFPLLALTATTTIRTPIACPILVIVIASEWEPSIVVSVIVDAIIPLSVCGKYFLNVFLWPRHQEWAELTCGFIADRFLKFFSQQNSVALWAWGFPYLWL